MTDSAAVSDGPVWVRPDYLAWLDGGPHDDFGETCPSTIAESSSEEYWPDSAGEEEPLTPPVSARPLPPLFPLAWWCCVWAIPGCREYDGVHGGPAVWPGIMQVIHERGLCSEGGTPIGWVHSIHEAIDRGVRFTWCWSMEEAAVWYHHSAARHNSYVPMRFFHWNFSQSHGAWGSPSHC